MDELRDKYEILDSVLCSNYETGGISESSYDEIMDAMVELKYSIDIPKYETGGDCHTCGSSVKDNIGCIIYCKHNPREEFRNNEINSYIPNCKPCVGELES